MVRSVVSPKLSLPAWTSMRKDSPIIDDTTPSRNTTNRLNSMYGPFDGQWSLRSDGAYTRSCGYAEQSFYWDSVHNRAVDALENIVINLRPGIPVHRIFNPQNVSRAWIQLKSMYPLLGARIEEHDGRVKFAVFKGNLRTNRPDEIVFKQVSSDEQASRILLEMLNAEKTLSLHHPARIYILTRSDMPQRVHLIYQVAHSVSDGISQATLKTTLLNFLVVDPPCSYRLEDRLALSVSSDTLWRNYPRNSPRHRWRVAIAAIMRQCRPLYGGHSLPQKVTTATHYSTVVSRRATTEFSPETSSLILARCKAMGVTFGSVFPILGQIATTRVLFRHYMRGEISEDEWDFRKREPMLTSGPINARPLLDKQWYMDGGKSHICAAVTWFTLILPFMPLGEMANVKPSLHMGMPPFSSFLSEARFQLRCRMAKDQLQRFLKHPLFFECGEASLPSKIRSVKEGAIKWRDEQTIPEEKRNRGEEISPIELSRTGPIWTFTGSSFGPTDDLWPQAFPLELKPGQEPVMKIERNELQLRCRPGHLYLSSTFYRGRMCVFAQWDMNVYQEHTVKDFLSEIHEAAKWYLARDVSGSNIGAKL